MYLRRVSANRDCRRGWDVNFALSNVGTWERVSMGFVGVSVVIVGRRQASISALAAERRDGSWMVWRMSQKVEGMPLESPLRDPTVSLLPIL